ncbi:protein of unknown function [Nitrospira japonica]|uniref:Uncharacterized protein n=1 Tax=Nitrospira japonica TaxID=1325564 RepID=A0A1W1I503_9BACT|nr:protein of unknown function [Nitrospira japonica]
MRIVDQEILDPAVSTGDHARNRHQRRLLLVDLGTRNLVFRECLKDGTETFFVEYEAPF